LRDQIAAGADPVPIAPSWLLFGTGVIPRFFRRRGGRKVGRKKSQAL